jgi:hypothetical protein
MAEEDRRRQLIETPHASLNAVIASGLGNTHSTSISTPATAVSGGPPPQSQPIRMMDATLLQGVGHVSFAAYAAARASAARTSRLAHGLKPNPTQPAQLATIVMSLA